MKKVSILLGLLALGCSAALAAATSGAAADDRLLLIDPSSMPVGGGGKATLLIDPLRRTNGVFAGAYHLKVSPYFFKSEKGRLAILVPDETLAQVNTGKVATVTGTATTSGKAGHSRHIDAIATPVDRDHGTLRLWFLAGTRKMTFTPTYHLAPAPPAPKSKS
jgi:hypothetical protein